jgi:nicotinamide mononucleotide adenylyltransferase
MIRAFVVFGRLTPPFGAHFSVLKKKAKQLIVEL